MRILIVSPKNKTVFNFRGDLIKDMISRGNQVLVVGPNQEFVEDILALGVEEFIEVKLVKDNTSILGDFAYLRRLLRVMKEKKPDMVFSYTIKPVVYGSIAAKLAKVRRIYAMVTGLGRVYAAGGAKAKLVRLITNTLYKIAFRFCKHIIFQNGTDIDQMVEEKLLDRTKAVQVSGSGVNMERFFRSPLPESPVFLMVSRIIREKGVLEYCQAARQVRSQFPDARCLLLGGFDSSMGALKQEDIQPYIDDGSIEFLDEVKDPVSIYQQCSVFVLPSYYREGLPRTLLEAMSCGRAVVTTDWPGCREPVVHGENGFLVPVRDAKALADRMLQLAEDSGLRQQLAQGAYETCKQTYEVGIVNRQMQDVLRY